MEDPPRENITIPETLEVEESDPTETTPLEEPLNENVQND